MLEFVVASHGSFAKEAVNSAVMICGEEHGNIHILSIQDGAGGIEQFEADAEKLAEELAGSSVLILSDLFGGSPFMSLLSKFRDNNYKLVSGFNLPMVIEAFQDGELTLDEASAALIEIGKNVSIRLVDKLV